MKILYPLQQSVVKDGYWSVADSNINMMVGFVKALNDLRPSWKVDVVIAPVGDFCGITSHKEIVDSPNVNFVTVRGPVDAFYARQNFDLPFWYDLLVSQDYDVIISNITEHTRQLKTIVFKEGLKAKIVAQCFWMDTPFINESKVDKEITYTFRQIDGMLAADLCAFTCNSTKEAFLDNLNAISGYLPGDDLSELAWEINDKATIWDFGYDDKEFPNLVFSLPKTNRDKINIGFLNRITTGDYTNFGAFVRALQLLQRDAEYKNSFNTFITDPGNRVDKEWAREYLPGYTEFENETREDYKKLLADLDISVHLFLIERYGGCALRESIASCNVPVVAAIHEQANLVDDWGLQAMVSFEGDVAFVDPNEVAKAIAYAIDIVRTKDIMTSKKHDKVRASLIKTYKENFERCSFSKTTEVVVKDIELITAE